MKRDWDVIRAILLQLEAAPNASPNLNAGQVKGHDEQLVAYNMRLIHQAGAIEGKFLDCSDGTGQIRSAVAIRMTNKGHELLDTIRNDTVWGKVKEKIGAAGLDLTFDLVLSAGKQVMEDLLG